MDSEHQGWDGLADDLGRRWQRLDLQRFTGRPVEVGDGLGPGRPDLAEHRALLGFHDAALNRAKRPSLVRTALADLDAAYLETEDLPARGRIAARRLSEALRAYRTLPAGTVPLSSLDLAARSAWQALTTSALAVEGDDDLLLRCALGEFFKEAYTSKLMRDAISVAEFGMFGSDEEVHRLLIEYARDVLDPVRDLLTSGEVLDRYSTIIAAGAVRHLAVVHEFFAFRADCPSERRIEHLHEWLRLSADAAAVCADHEEFNTQGYALMNKAAALAEITASEPPKSQLSTLIENAKEVRAAQSLFEMTGDDRGLAWSSIHLARICARQYEISERSATGAELADTLRNMLEASIDALSNSRRIDDEVAQGLASLYLCAAEKEAHRLGLHDLTISDEPEIADRARQAARVLSATHRLPQAARALQIAAQCELVVADREVDAYAKSASRMKAMNDLTDAIAILDESGDLDRKTSERLIIDLHNSVAAAVPRWRF